MSVADLHGHTCWKKPVAEFIAAQPDDNWCVIFTGDYFDSFTYSGPDQLANAQEVALLKEQHPDNVVLLLGNHDLGYTCQHPDD